jgi:acyl dehydratase
VSGNGNTAGGMAEQKLFFDDVSEGDSAPECTHELTRTDLVMYAGASGDFNPMHTDEVKAKEAGLPSVFGHGMFTAGLLGRALTDYVGVGNLRTYKIRFTKQTWPGEQLTTHVTVARKYDEGHEHRVDLECSVTNQAGEAKLTGVAVAALPAGG